MILNEKQVKSIAVGAITTELKEDGYHFFKCTEKQLAAFAALDEGLGKRALATTGVRLDFHTDSKRLRFSANGGGRYELHIDGLLKERFYTEEKAVFSYEREDNAKSAEYRVTLVLPAHGAGVISEIELDDGATLRPHTFDRRFLFIGDSITQGWNSSINALSFAYRTSFFYNAESVIQGTGGAFFHESTFDALPFDPDTVFVALGTNDFGHFQSMEEMSAHANAHLALIAEAYKGKKIYYISPIWRASQERPMGSFAKCRSTLIAIAEKYGFEHIDGFSLVPSHPAFFTEDLLHPNDIGFSMFSENLIRTLER